MKKTMRLNLSCYCCGSVDFENKPLRWNEVEDMFFLDCAENEDNKILLKCSKCGLEDYLFNLIPRGVSHEEWMLINNPKIICRKYEEVM